MEVGGEREYIPIDIHCHHPNDSCIRMGSEECQFNVSVGSEGKSHKTVSTDHNRVAARTCGSDDFNTDVDSLHSALRLQIIIVVTWLFLRPANQDGYIRGI